MSIHTIQTSFASGEVSPSLFGRPDLAKYASGLRRCENFIIHPHGGMSKRSGMRFVAAAKGRCRLVEFEYSLGQAYVLEFGDRYVRFFRDGAQIMAGGVPYEVTTPYALADIDGLSFTQSADVLYIVHSSYRPKELYRVSDSNWLLADFDFKNGPFRQHGTEFEDVAVALSATEGTVTLTASAPIFEAGHVGSLFSVIHHVDEVTLKGSGVSELPVLEVTAYGGWRLESGGFWGGTVVLEYWDEDESAWVRYKTYVSQAYSDGTTSSCGNAKNYSDQDTVDEPTRLRVRAESFTSFVPEGNSDEDRGYFQLSANAAAHRAVMRITAVASGSSATAVMLTKAAATKATANWEAGAWSDAEGWPSAVGFYQERMVMGSTKEQPQSWWMSRSGDYYDFGVSFEALDDEAVSGSLVSRKMFDLKYFVSLGDLLIMTSGGEWKLSSGAAGGAVTPTNVDVGLQGNRGCADIDPAVVGNMILFVQSRGLRIRDLGYEYASDSYTGNDLTVLARHLFEGHEVKDWAFALEPDSMAWLVREDGLLLGLTYIREHEVVAWGRYPTDGAVESVASVISQGADMVYLCVRRGDKRFIELMSPAAVDEAAEAFMLDCGVTSSFASDTAAVTGLDHLEGRTVSALADGDVVEGLTVTGGSVTLPYGAKLVHVGLPYAAVAETLDLVYQRQDGAQLTRKSRVSSLKARVERTRGLFAGAALGAFGNGVYAGPGVSEAQLALLSELPGRSDEESGCATRLFSGDLLFYLSSGYDEGRVVLYAPYPLPCSVLALAAEVETVS